jgi:heme-degrading monooxygenase HmoA
MFVRVRHWTTELGEWDRFVSRLEHEGLQGMKGTDGFQRMVVTGDPMSNSVVTITFWESEAQERAYETTQAADFHNIVKEMVAAPPETLAYPVVVDQGNRG